jgi:hypothetical protein
VSKGIVAKRRDEYMPTMGVNAVQNAQPNNPNAGAAVSGSGTAQASAPAASFGRSGKFHMEQGATQNVSSAAWAPSVTQQFNVPTYGFMSMLNLTCTLAAGAKGATVTVAPSADAPWDVFSNINITDVNGTSMWNLDGYASQLAYLFGGYRFFPNNFSQFGYTPIDGTAGSGLGTGNGKFKFQFPFEFGQDGLGNLPNMDAGAQYRLNLTYNGPSVFYNGAAQQPATLPNISTLLELYARNKPASVDAYNNPQSTQPPALGSIQNWTSQVLTVNNGANTLQLTRTGNLVRNHFFIFRAADGTRATAESTGVVPSVIEFDIDAGIRYKCNVDTWRNFTAEWYGFDIPAGVIAFPNTIDPDNQVGNEYGAQWLPTTGSTKLQLQFNTSAAGTLQVVTNDIIPGSGLIYSAASMAIMV